MDKKAVLDELVVAEVNKQIDRIRPIIEAHRGGVEIIYATPDVLVLKLLGHCADCALAPMTYGLVLEKYIREAIPTLKEVRYTSENKPDII